MIDKKEIFPIGMGTWKINYQNNDDKNALLYSYSLGQNYLSLYMLYENGNIVKSLKSFIEKCGRENLFISVNIEPTINEKSDIENQLNEYLKILNLDFVAYQPLRRNRTHLRNYDLLVELSRRYNKSQNQIILNWIIKEKNIKVLIKSTNCNRIDENIESLNFKMEKNDYKRLNDFKNEEFENIKIDWNNTGDGISIETTGYSRNQVFAFQKYIDLFLK